MVLHQSKKHIQGPAQTMRT